CWLFYIVFFFFYLFFFFSSRRRHTRFSRDWSSDVCSSDLAACRSARWLTASFRPFRFVSEKAVVERGFGGFRADRRQAIAHDLQIGRASCRERVEISVGAGAFKKKIEQKNCARISSHSLAR